VRSGWASAAMAVAWVHARLWQPASCPAAGSCKWAVKDRHASTFPSATHRDEVVVKLLGQVIGGVSPKAGNCIPSKVHCNALYVNQGVEQALAGEQAAALAALGHIRGCHQLHLQQAPPVIARGGEAAVRKECIAGAQAGVFSGTRWGSQCVPKNCWEAQGKEPGADGLPPALGLPPTLEPSRAGWSGACTREPGPGGVISPCAHSSAILFVSRAFSWGSAVCSTSSAACRMSHPAARGRRPANARSACSRAAPLAA
jgi:hypothetical protein